MDLGTTPLRDIRVPVGRLRVRARKDGYEELLVARTGLMLVSTDRQPTGLSLPGRAPGAALGIAPGLDLQPVQSATGRMC